MSSTTHNARIPPVVALCMRIRLLPLQEPIRFAEFRPLTSSKKLAYVSKAFLPKIIPKNSCLSKREIVPRQNKNRADFTLTRYFFNLKALIPQRMKVQERTFYHVTQVKYLSLKSPTIEDCLAAVNTLLYGKGKQGHIK